jgi:hypothetical protein
VGTIIQSLGAKTANTGVYFLILLNCFGSRVDFTKAEGFFCKSARADLGLTG